MKVAVLGAGAWGTALAVTMSARHEMRLWSRNPEQVQEMARTRVNARYLPDVPLPEALQLTADSAAALAGAELAIVGASLAGLRFTLRLIAGTAPGVPVVWLCKGFETGASRLPHQVAAEELAPGCMRAALSGPSFAQEVVAGIPAAVTLASPDVAFAAEMARQLHGKRLRIYASDDLPGVEVGGAVKNVIAIAAGISDGLRFGESARAALITRGLAEITRLGIRLGGRMETFMGLSGVGDLILTCAGNLSRNRQVGLRLAAGKSLDMILAELGHVAEGVHSAREARRLARQSGVDMPITDAVCRVLFEGMPAPEAVDMLLAREPGCEHRL